LYFHFAALFHFISFLFYFFPFFIFSFFIFLFLHVDVSLEDPQSVQAVLPFAVLRGRRILRQRGVLLLLWSPKAVRLLVRKRGAAEATGFGAQAANGRHHPV
jgi:hypothetical protein